MANRRACVEVQRTPGISTRNDYAYAMRFRDGKIIHMTKVWNDGYALKELGWA